MACYNVVMPGGKGPLRVARVRSSWSRQDGTTNTHESALLRRTWREGNKVVHETVASLTGESAQTIDYLEAVLNKGAVPTTTKTTTGCDDGQGWTQPGVELGPGLAHGGVAAAFKIACDLGLPALIGGDQRIRDIAMGLIIARVCHPGSKLSATRWFPDSTLTDLGLGDVSADEAYQAMDHLGARQGVIEDGLAARYLTDPVANPGRLVFYDLSSTWIEGTCCELAQYGYSRDGKKGLTQIEFALITNPQGIPVAIRVFKGSTADPVSMNDCVDQVAKHWQISDAVLVGDRAMITSKRVAELSQGKDTASLGWIGALKHPAIARLAEQREAGLQDSLFDQQGCVSSSRSCRFRRGVFASSVWQVFPVSSSRRLLVGFMVFAVVDG